MINVVKCDVSQSRKLPIENLDGMEQFGPAVSTTFEVSLIIQYDKGDSVYIQNISKAIRAAWEESERQKESL